jgi:hypothetical protein
MNAEELPAFVESLRTSLAAIHEVARKCCGVGDLNRAARSMGVQVGREIDAPGGDADLEMVADLVFFGANDRGVRPFDRFLAGPVRTLPEREQELARRMGRAWFSVFRRTGEHETTGTWVEDILDNDRRIWMIDVHGDERKPSHSFFAARVFDAGPFHLTLASIVLMGDRMANVFKRAQDTGRRPFRRSLEATIYGLVHLKGVPPIHASGKQFVADLGPELQPGDPDG